VQAVGLAVVHCVHWPDKGPEVLHAGNTGFEHIKGRGVFVEKSLWHATHWKVLVLHTGVAGVAMQSTLVAQAHAARSAVNARIKPAPANPHRTKERMNPASRPATAAERSPRSSR
jgi:hypothetical protein